MKLGSSRLIGGMVALTVTVSANAGSFTNAGTTESLQDKPDIRTLDLPVVGPKPAAYFAIGGMALSVPKSSQRAIEIYSAKRMHSPRVADGQFSKTISAPVTLGEDIFDPPMAWGAEHIEYFSAHNIDHGGIKCNNTYGDLHGGIMWWYLDDEDDEYDYLAVTVNAVVEIADGADNCDDYIDWARISHWTSSGTVGNWIEQSPMDDFTGSCADVRIGYTGAYGNFETRLHDTVGRCDTWEVQGAGAWHTSDPYGIVYDNNGNCGAESLVIAQVSVIRWKQSLPKVTLKWGWGLDVDNVKSSKGGC